MKVIKWWNFSSDESYLHIEEIYLVMKVKEVEIAKEVKRSDGWWRFACGDVYFHSAQRHKSTPTVPQKPLQIAAT